MSLQVTTEPHKNFRNIFLYLVKLKKAVMLWRHTLYFSHKRNRGTKVPMTVEKQVKCATL